MMNSETPLSIDALLPAEMALKAEEAGAKKAAMNPQSIFALAVLAGIFISLGAVFATIVTTTIDGDLPWGISKLIGGVVFCLGLILVVVGGAELFTGNNLIVMSVASGKTTVRKLLKNWLIVYAGNFLGCLAIAVLIFLARQYLLADGKVGYKMLAIANHKSQLDAVQAVTLGILCNALVCLAVWLCYSARSTTDKILSILFPITAFVTAGFEHCIANMYYLAEGILVKFYAPDAFWSKIGSTPERFAELNIYNAVFVNLLPVTVGNIIGGSVLIGAVYWMVFVRKIALRRRQMEQIVQNQTEK